MAYSVITTPVSGTTISTTDFGIKVKDNFDAAFPLGVDGWTSYTPTLTQSGTVTKTVNYAKYQRVGRLITVTVGLSVTGTGTASNLVTITLPVTAASNATVNLPCGLGVIFDTSAAATYKGLCRMNTSGTLVFLDTVHSTAGTGLGVADFTAALASGDVVAFSATYEAVS